MTTFLRLLADQDKASGLFIACGDLRAGETDDRTYQVSPESFYSVPGAPFAYWVSDAIRKMFTMHSAFESNKRAVRVGDHPGDGFRYLRLSWEVLSVNEKPIGWVPYQKGGAYSPFYADIHLLANWNFNRSSYQGFYGRAGRSSERPSNYEFFFRPGLTWSRRSQLGLSLRPMSQGCIFADKGPAVLVDDDALEPLLALLGIMNSKAFRLLVSLQMAVASYEVGVIQKTPIPDLKAGQQAALAALAYRAWSLKRTLDTIEETSHAFLLPAALRNHLSNYDSPVIELEIKRIQSEIDDLAFELYGFSEEDRAAAEVAEDDKASKNSDKKDSVIATDKLNGLLSWAVGVIFGRFHWSLATGERAAPPEPAPFDPLPEKSPGMLFEGDESFHRHVGILVDDAGHPHDVARLVEDACSQVEAQVPTDVRRWLQREFFPYHLKRYSKSRRKAPIYWPLATPSGSYTLWVYYPDLSSQTLYTAVNNFVEPKLEQIEGDLDFLRNKGGARSREDEKEFETLQALEIELVELHDALLEIAPTYKPSHDDGVQITAAPLWALFRYKPWQNVLRDTWAKLEKGDYDWAHLAMSYWPDRVYEKCKADKSLAIAHNLEQLYDEHN